jgi:hypothetical protein
LDRYNIEVRRDIMVSKDGWKTSEFWMMIFAVAAPLFGLPVSELSAVGAGLYAAGRSAFKIWG